MEKLARRLWELRIDRDLTQLEAAKRAAYLFLNDLDLSMELDKMESPDIRQMYILNLPQEW